MSEETEDKDEMTPAQRQALEKAWDLLSEFFERVLLVVDYDVSGDNGKEAQCHEGFWHGGALAGIGMAEYAKDRILRSGTALKDSEPED